MRGRVLVVDDDPSLSEMLGIVLRGEGLEAAFVADGDAALGPSAGRSRTWCCST
jgi:two-component system response regulator MtrA